MVARHSQNSQGIDGFSLYFVPREIFDEQSQIYQKFQQIADNADGYYEILPWLALEPQTWYYMQIEGEQLDSGGNITTMGL